MIFYRRNILKLAHLTALALGVLSSILSAEGAQSSPTIVLFLENGLSGLQTSPCFTNWRHQLAEEGLTTQVILTPIETTADQYVATLNSIGKTSRLWGSMLIGNIDLPEVNLDVYDVSYDANHNQVYTPAIRKVQTILPLLIPSTSLNDPAFYRKLAIYTHLEAGVISDGKSGRSTAERIQNYCSYFERNMAYRTCSHATKKLSIVTYTDKAEPTWREWQNEMSEGEKSILSFRRLSNLSEMQTINNHADPIDYFQILEHSDAVRHVTPSGDVTVEDVAKWQPAVRFYNLYACSAGEYIDRPNLAQTYLFTRDTLGVYASTRPGSIPVPGLSKMYEDLTDYDDVTLGGAFDDMQASSYDPTQQQWEREVKAGVILYGDPTLKIYHCQK